MPAMEKWGKFQNAVLWICSGYDGFGMPAVFETPTTIRVRWDDTYRQSAGRDGSPLVIEAVISTNRELPIGSLVWKGRESDLPTTGTKILNVMEVHSVEVVPDLKVRSTYREYQLKRFKNQIGNTVPETT